jgi:hypothetical protein
MAAGNGVREIDKLAEAARRDHVELLAALGPAGILSPLAGSRALKAVPEPKGKPGRTAKVKPAVMEAPFEKVEAPSEKTAPLPLASDAAIDGFIARRLEVVQGSHIPAKALFEMWLTDCAGLDIAPGTQKAFSQPIQKRVGYERNNGRPRYCHVAFKVKAPSLRVVGGSRS